MSWRLRLSRNWNVLMLYRFIWVLGADSMKIIYLWTSPCNARIDLNSIFSAGPRWWYENCLVRSSTKFRNQKLRIPSWARRDALFSRNWVRRLKSLTLNGKWRVLCEVDWGRRIFEKYLGHFRGLILDLKARLCQNRDLSRPHLPI